MAQSMKMTPDACKINQDRASTQSRLDYEHLRKRSTRKCACCDNKAAKKATLSCGHRLCLKCKANYDKKTNSNLNNEAILCDACRKEAAPRKASKSSDSDSDDEYDILDPKTMLPERVTSTGDRHSLAEQWQDSTIIKAEYLHDVLAKKPLGMVRPYLQSLPGSEQQNVVNELVEGCTALYMAVARNALLLIAYMLEECGADPNQMSFVPNGNGELIKSNCLIKATSSNNIDAVQLLVINGADVNLADGAGWTPLTVACYKGHDDLVKYLVNSGADIHFISHENVTCLLLSIPAAEIVEFLLSRGSDVHECDSKGRTGLHKAAEMDSAECLQVLLNHGADVNFQDEDGNTPLIEAILFGSIESVKLLLKHGADMYIRNNDKEDAILTANIKYETDIVHYLITAHKENKHKHQP